MLVALNKSAVENGLKRERDKTLPPAVITVAVETVVDTHSDAAEEDDTCSPSESESDNFKAGGESDLDLGLNFGLHGFDAEPMEDAASTMTSEESTLG